MIPVPAPPSAGDRPESLRTVLLVIGIGSVLRMLIGWLTGLSVDESYTTAIARSFALSYFDHPPIHVWMVGGWARLAGSEADLIVRLPFIAMFAGSSWLLYRLTADAYDQRSGIWALLAMSLSPLFTVGVGSWILPDGPLVFFMLLTALAVQRAVLGNPSPARARLWWLVAGAAAGLSMLSKYLAVFPLLGVGLFLVTTRYRKVLLTAWPWLALLLALALFMPVIVWNAMHGWASLAFQGSRAIPASISVGRCLLSLLGQFAYLSFPTGVGLCMVLWRTARRGAEATPDWFFFCLAIGAVGFFTAAALWTTVLPHWPAVGWLFAMPLLGRWLTELESSRPRMTIVLSRVTAGLLVFFLGIAVSQARTGWLDHWVRSFPAHDPMVDQLDWRELKSALEARQLLRADTLVGTLSPVDAGKVDYALGGGPVVLCLTPAAHQYGLLHDPRGFVGRDVLLVANGRRRNWLELAAPYFSRLEPLDDVTLTRAGEAVLTLKIARGIGLKNPDIPP